MVFDLARGVFVMFGGRQNNGAIVNETWELVELGPRASYRVFGRGCGTSKYQPALRPDPIFNSAPVLGGNFTLRGDSMPPGQLALLAVGASDKTWSGLPLPLSLTVLGMPGCNVFVSLDIIDSSARTDAGGRVWWTSRIPNDPKLLGVVFYNQAAVIAPGANLAGLLWTNAGSGVIGAY